MGACPALACVSNLNRAAAAPATAAVPFLPTRYPPYAVATVTLAWPLVHPTSYARRRSPALAVLRLFLFAMPFHYNKETFDVIAPPRAGYRLGGYVSDFFGVFLGERS